MASPRYIADPDDAVRVVALDGLSVLFHRPSGMTHIVAAPAPEILQALREGPADAGELLARLKAVYEFEDEAVAEAVAARLEELELAGLVWREPFPPCREAMGRGTSRRLVEGLSALKKPLHHASHGPPSHEAAPHREDGDNG